MIRRLFNISSVVSLLTCIAAATLWARQGPQELHVLLTYGEFSLFLSGPYFCYEGPPQIQAITVISSPQKLFPTTMTNRPGSRVMFFKFSHIVLATAPLPLVWHWRFTKRPRKTEPASCRKCGYNLTANTSGICPECGMPILRVVSSATDARRMASLRPLV